MLIVLTQYLKEIERKGTSCEGCHFDIGGHRCGLDCSKKLECSEGYVFKLVSEALQWADED